MRPPRAPILERLQAVMALEAKRAAESEGKKERRMPMSESEHAGDQLEDISVISMALARMSHP